MQKLIQRIIENNLTELDKLLAFTDINIVDEFNNSLLHYAIYYKRSNICFYLIDKHIFINKQNNYNFTPLYLAVHYNLIEVVNKLLKNNANDKLLANNHETPFYHACLLKREEIIDLFIEYKLADFNYVNELGENCFFAFIKSNANNLFKKYFNIKYLYSKNKYNDTLLHISAKYNNYDISNFLINNKLYINIFNKEKVTPLYYAVLNKNYKLIRLFLDNYALTFKDEKLINDINNVNENLLLYDKTNIYILNYLVHYSIIIGDINLFKKNYSNYYLHVKDYLGYDIKSLSKLLNNTIYKQLKNIKC